jgi:NitT/TauT family transport system ATP-binding protein
MLEIRNISKTFGEGENSVCAIGNVALTTRDGEFLSVLQCVSGLLKPSSGVVSFGNQPIDGPPEGLAVVFQDYSRSLFPWMTVLGNVEAALITQRLGKAERRERSNEALASVGLASMGQLYPWQLSGGMQQRVAIARALVTQPTLLVMDEPFASVDAQMRIQLEDLLLSLWSKRRSTILFVTHDVDEAAYMSDRILILSPRPTRVLKEIEVDLERPRNQITTKATSRFQQIRADILHLMQQWDGTQYTA